MQKFLSRFRVCGIRNQIMTGLQIICETYSIQHPRALSHNAIIVISPFYIYFQGQRRSKETNISAYHAISPSAVRKQGRKVLGQNHLDKEGQQAIRTLGLLKHKETIILALITLKTIGWLLNFSSLNKGRNSMLYRYALTNFTLSSCYFKYWKSS